MQKWTWKGYGVRSCLRLALNKLKKWRVLWIPWGTAIRLLVYYWWKFFTFFTTFVKWLTSSQMCSLTSYSHQCIKVLKLVIWYSWIEDIIHFIFLYTINCNRWGWLTNPSWDAWCMVKFQQGNMKHKMDLHRI
jgi:hypothetical protein